MSRIIGYMRLSSSKSLAENGFQRQKEGLSKAGCTEYVEDVISGSVRNRTGLDSLLNSLAQGDTVVVSSIDRLARNTAHLLQITEIIREKGAYLKSVNDSWLDTSEDNPMSQFLLTVMGGLAELERELIKQRITEGVAIARANGTKFGRKRTKTKQITAAVEAYRVGGMTGQQIAENFGISRSSLYKALKEQEYKEI